MESLEDMYQQLRKYKMALDYVVPSVRYDTEKPYLLSLDVPVEDEPDRSNLEFAEVYVDAADARPINNSLSVEVNGFELVDVGPGFVAKYFNGQDKATELAGIHALMKEKFQAEKVIIYDHAVRRCRP